MSLNMCVYSACELPHIGPVHILSEEELGGSGGCVAASNPRHIGREGEAEGWFTFIEEGLFSGKVRAVLTAWQEYQCEGKLCCLKQECVVLAVAVDFVTGCRDVEFARGFSQRLGRAFLELRGKGEIVDDVYRSDVCTRSQVQAADVYASLIGIPGRNKE